MTQTILTPNTSQLLSEAAKGNELRKQKHYKRFMEYLIRKKTARLAAQSTALTNASYKPLGVFSFLRLPPELRREVYRLLLPPADCKIGRAIGRPIDKLDDDELCDLPSVKHVPSMMLVDRQVSMEFRELLYTEMTFAAKAIRDPGLIGDFHMLSTESMGAVRTYSPRGLFAVDSLGLAMRRVQKWQLNTCLQVGFHKQRQMSWSMRLFSKMLRKGGAVRKLVIDDFGAASATAWIGSSAIRRGVCGPSGPTRIGAVLEPFRSLRGLDAVEIRLPAGLLDDARTVAYRNMLEAQMEAEFHFEFERTSDWYSLAEAARRSLFLRGG